MAFSQVATSASQHFVKISLHLPKLQGGDWFDTGCIHHHAVRCEPAFSGLCQIARNLRAFSRVLMWDVRSLPPVVGAIAQILACSLWALQRDA
jgi:hypothetical protein